MQDNCLFGDMLKDEKRKSQFKYELGRLMGAYAVPLPLDNFCSMPSSHFSNVHFRKTTKIAPQVLALNFLLSLLLSLFSNYEFFMYFCFCFFFHSYGSFNCVNFNILELL